MDELLEKDLIRRANSIYEYYQNLIKENFHIDGICRI